MSKKKAISLGMIVMFIGVWGYHLWFQRKPIVLQHTATPVSLATVSTHLIPLTVPAVGTVQAPETVTLATPQAGLVTRCSFSYGESVKRHQLLLEQDNHLQRLQLQQAVADYRTKFDNYQRQIKLQKASPGAISMADLTTTKGAVAVARALMQSKRIALQDTQIYAPFAGTIEPLAPTSGSLLSAGSSAQPMLPYAGAYLAAQQAFARLVDRDHVVVTYALPAAWRKQVKRGQSVEIHLATGMARVIHGTVSYVSPDIDESNQTIQVQARVVGCVDCVPGLRVSVAHVIAPHRRILAVPGLSLVPSLTGYSVYQVRNNRVVPVTVDTGERFGSWVVISKGLKVGDRIITAGLQAVSAGNLVRVV